MAAAEDVQNDLLFIIAISLFFIFTAGLARSEEEAQPTVVPIIVSR